MCLLTSVLDPVQKLSEILDLDPYIMNRYRTGRIRNPDHKEANSTFDNFFLFGTYSYDCHGENLTKQNIVRIFVVIDFAHTINLILQPSTILIFSK
jgi:hypothetical protein